ncbi:Bacterial regulatory proteins, tetR family [Variovorax sp. PBS-H4]|uniref:TetR/AcrR family transcriptional regulator n=1 Tax=Variovorax sp. PBS-H4 TaxID=434008 RepID=UPI001315F1E1|nr:TetR/AcrR family transcriptional regulator [Variovorax sp. PBS-H4]VTU27482.1 Bacterial regulatory proteins, tetR family [Variovorax sp. PBS-H4]
MESPELSPKAAEIAACARLLLATKGYNGFSYADISEAVHISKASVHFHFPSKAELVQTVLRRYRAQGREALAALEKQIADPLARLHAYTEYWEACIRDGTAPFCICAMLGSELPAIPSVVADEVRGHFSDLATWLASILEQGAAKGIFCLRTHPSAEALGLMATVHGGMLAARVYGDPDAFATVVQQGVKQLLAPARRR